MHTWEVGGIIWDSAAVVSFLLGDEELRRSVAHAHLRQRDDDVAAAADEGGDAKRRPSWRSGSPVASLINLRDADVLDLGTGTGLVGLAAAAAGARSVTMTDNLDSVIGLCERNRRANPSLRARTRAVNHSWGEPVPPPLAAPPPPPPPRQKEEKSKKKTTKKGVSGDVEMGIVGVSNAMGMPLLATDDSDDGIECGGGGGHEQTVRDGGGGGVKRTYDLVLAIDCMHCAARTGGVERLPLAATLEEACGPGGACVLFYEPRGFSWDPVDEPFVARVEQSFDATHVPLRWVRVEDESGAAKRWKEWLGRAPHDWFHRGRADNLASIRLVMLTPKTSHATD